MNLKMNAGYAAGELVKDGQVLGLGTDEPHTIL